MNVESRLKTALDESRLLIGAQVLFGFPFEAALQKRFPARQMHGAGLVLMLISISLLIAPSLFHQIIFAGESRPGAIGTATMLAGASLLPLPVGGHGASAPLPTLRIKRCSYLCGIRPA